MSYLFIESTEDFVAGPYRVRIWREESEVLEHYDNSDVIQAAGTNAFARTRAQLAADIAALPRINAVEVKKMGVHERGIVLYNNW